MVDMTNPPEKVNGVHRFVVSGTWTVIEDANPDDPDDPTLRLDEDNMLALGIVCLDCHAPRALARSRCYAAPSDWWEEH